MTLFILHDQTTPNMYKEDTGKWFAIDDLPVIILCQLAGAVGRENFQKSIKEFNNL